MKILVLTSVYPQPDDDKKIVTATVEYYCKNWIKIGDEVIVIHNKSKFPCIYYMIPKLISNKINSDVGFSLPTFKSRKLLCRKENKMLIYRLPMWKIIPHSKFSKYQIRKQILKIKKILYTNNFIPDIIIGHWVNPQIELLLKLGNYYHAKTSLVFHNDCNMKNMKLFNLKYTTKNLDAIGCRSENYAIYVKNNLQINKMPFICYSGIPDKVVEEQINKKCKLVNNRNFLFVGRLVKYKNVDVIIKALYEAFPNKNFLLQIVGDGAELYKLKQLVIKCNLTDNVIFYGQLSREKVFDLMKKSFCFTMVSNCETFGMVYIEAMLAGCVTIASRGGGIDGVIKDGINGFLSNEGDVSSLVNLYKIISNLSLDESERLRRRAIETASNFKDSTLAKKYLDNILSWNNN